MPPKTASTSSLSDREMQLLRNYFSCMESKPVVRNNTFLCYKRLIVSTTDLFAQINMEKFATMSGFGNVPSAKANSTACCASSPPMMKPLAHLPLTRLLKTTTLSQSLRPARRSLAVASTSLVSLTFEYPLHARRLTTVIDTAAGDDAEEETPSKKKTSVSKRKGKAAADTADQEEEIFVKSEAD
jgi:hypothetical protein